MTSVHPVAPERSAARAAAALLVVIDVTAASSTSPGARPALTAVVATPIPRALVSTSASPSRRPALVRMRSGMHLADDRQPVLRLRVVHAVPAHHGEPALLADLGPAGHHLGQHGHRQLRRRPRHDVQREQRPPAHRVHVGDGVLRGDPAPGAGIVDDGGEEIGGRHQRSGVVESPHGGVVTGLRADEQVGVPRRGHGLQDLGQLAGSELAGAPRAVAELREAPGRNVVGRRWNGHRH